MKKSKVGDIFRRFHRRIFGFCLRLSKNVALAEEVSQSVFLKLLSHRRPFQSEQHLRLWLFRVARNMTINELARQKTMRAGADALTMVDGRLDSTQEHHFFRSEEAKRVAHGLSCLNPDQRTAICLREYEGMSYREIAEITGFSMEKVKIDIFRARDRLRQLLAQDGRKGD